MHICTYIPICTIGTYKYISVYVPICAYMSIIGEPIGDIIPILYATYKSNLHRPIGPHISLPYR